MKVLYYDCFSGVSGDMNLGAMIDLGVPGEYLINELSKLNLSEYEINIKRDMRKGITGTKVDVILNNESHKNHRHLSHIKNIIESSSLSTSIKDLSLKIFYTIAEAESKIHNESVDEVHFHEVGAVDAIIDIVGAVICLDYLKVDKVFCTTIELGGGFVKCEHGIIPVPAPAVVEILKGIPIKSGAVPFETTTPTGAAILTCIVDEFTDNKKFIIKNIGYGVGNRDTEIPNVLRAFLGKVS